MNEKKPEGIGIGYDIYECSECTQLICTGDIDVYKFCHACGARMLEH